MRAQLKFLTTVALGPVFFVGSLASPARGEPPIPPLSTRATPTQSPLPGLRSWNLRQTPVVEVVRRVKDAVVNIHSERTVRSASVDDLFALTPSQSRVNGMGTGIIIDKRGYIVTNQHVVDDVSALRVRLSDGTTHNAQVVARDVESDLALLKISAPRSLPVMPLGTARDLQVAETVVAIGNAYGYDHTVTVGVVSATGRDVSLNKEVRYKSLIQTDAAINPGNSGGPLVNLHGELIGVNVAIRAGAQGIGFAIPVDTMIHVASRMLAQVRTRHGVGTLGLALADESPNGTTRKVVVNDVAGGPAQKAGIQKGDELVKVGDLAAHSSLDLERALIDLEAGTKVNLVVKRDGAEKKVTLTLDAPPKTETHASASMTTTTGLTTNQHQSWRQIGLRLQPLGSPNEITRLFPQLHGGLLIGEIRPDSPGAKAGLRTGDVLVGLHQWEMTTMENVLYVLNHPDRATFSPLRFYIIRAGQVHRGWLQIAE